MSTAATKQALAPAEGGPGAMVESAALQWLWKHLADVPNPHILDCGRANPQMLNLLIQRGGKIYVADLISTIQQANSMLWDRSQKVPVFLVDDFLAQLPNVPPDSLHAIFCWHLLDLLPREALKQVMDQLFICLRNRGVLFFLLREPHLQKGADATWWLETLTALAADGEGTKSFPFSVVSGRDVEKYLPAGSLKSYLTRSGRREVLVLK